MNIIHIIGRVGQDIKSRQLESGQKVQSFSLASNTRRKGQEETIWYNITVWGDRFDRMLEYVKKGSLLYVVGELQKPRLYQDKSGETQVSVDVTAESIKFVPGSKKDQDSDDGAGFSGRSATGFSSAQEPVGSTAGRGFESPFDDENDNIPF